MASSPLSSSINTSGSAAYIGFYSKRGERQIIGVVSDIRQAALDAPVEPTVYVSHAQAPTGAVTALGILGAGALTALLRGMLFSVVPLDVPTFGLVGALMLVTALIACHIPARRATRFDPLTALRAD